MLTKMSPERKYKLKLSVMCLMKIIKGQHNECLNNMVFWSDMHCTIMYIISKQEKFFLVQNSILC